MLCYSNESPWGKIACRNHGFQSIYVYWLTTVHSVNKNYTWGPEFISKRLHIEVPEGLSGVHNRYADGHLWYDGKTNSVDNICIILRGFYCVVFVPWQLWLCQFCSWANRQACCPSAGKQSNGTCEWFWVNKFWVLHLADKRGAQVLENVVFIEK